METTIRFTLPTSVCVVGAGGFLTLDPSARRSFRCTQPGTGLSYWTSQSRSDPCHPGQTAEAGGAVAAEVRKSQRGRARTPVTLTRS